MCNTGVSSYIDLVSSLHLRELRKFYVNVGPARIFKSHEMCLSCLRELPEHTIVCGHVLCNACVLSFGEKTGPTMVTMSQCPLHLDKEWVDKWRINIKPRHAGVRVMCLDGHLQKQLGKDLPLTKFFDLIVGTSAGGIIALGLGVESWSVDECMSSFRELCSEALRPREFRGVFGLRQLATYNHGSINRTKLFEGLLQSKFGPENLLFGGTPGGEIATKVAITSTTSVGHRAVIFTNYNRPDETEYKLPYKLQRAPGPETELKLWDVARETSAAPPYFKPFKKKETKESFEDGGLHHNCPVWVAHHESKLIWDDGGSGSPDVLLSIGTGESKHQVPQRTKGRGSSENNLLRRLFRTAKDRIDEALSCPRIWQEFSRENVQAQSRTSFDHRQRYIRINPELEQAVPGLDDVTS
ncbi:Phospholipase A I [Tolypocladium ophioglossoides CBS 100239]|uniref:Phospholipase A I n=1 Tax=Tolypocladium ophioglossoides (strain CBS 100239) TaxID=1163406 RepID=A0A0L0NDS8_TOLOC|nr:Phospholipase A I [Tolypocladium ophioglossoides CBS 100239]